MNPGIVQQIFNDHFDSYKAGRKLHSRERYAAWSIKTCKTYNQGYHINRCPNGDYQEVVLNSCKHRSCPQCGATKTEIWLQRRMATALNCRYFHVVTTFDHSLHIIWQYNRKLFTGLMMRAGKRWHTNIEPAYEQAEGVFKYLGRYISRGLISERRIVKYDGNQVTIAYAHREKHPEPMFTVTAKTFISRLLSHVPEKGIYTVPKTYLRLYRCNRF